MTAEPAPVQVAEAEVGEPLLLTQIGQPHGEILAFLALGDPDVLGAITECVEENRGVRRERDMDSVLVVEPSQREDLRTERRPDNLGNFW